MGLERLREQSPEVSSASILLNKTSGRLQSLIAKRYNYGRVSEELDCGDKQMSLTGWLSETRRDNLL